MGQALLKESWLQRGVQVQPHLGCIEMWSFTVFFIAFNLTIFIFSLWYQIRTFWHISIIKFGLGYIRCLRWGKTSACNVGDLGFIPGSGRSPGEGNGYPLQDPCLKNHLDIGACWATVHGVGKSRTGLSNKCFYFFQEMLKLQQQNHFKLSLTSR